MSSQDLDKAIKSINESASRTNTTTDFFNRVLDGGKTESAQNPLTGAVVPSVQKAVYDQYKNDINQIQQDVVDSNSAADRAESAANAVWNRRTVYAEVNASFADYQDEGRTITPRLSFDGSQYLPMFDSSVPVIFTGLPRKNGDCTITAATDKGDRQFSRVDAEAVARKDIEDFPIIATGSTYARNLKDRFADVVNVKDFGAKGDGVTDDTAAFRASDATNSPVLVPKGTYKVSAPTPSGLYYGEGVVDVSGVQFKLDYSIPTRINTGTPVDPSDPDTITQEGRYFNLFIGQGTAPNVNTTDARASTVIGYGALSEATTPIRLTGVGKQAFHKAIDGYTCDAFGSDALGWGKKFERCTAIGSNALKWAGAPDPVGVLHDFWKPYSDGTYTDFIDAIHLSDSNRWPTIRQYLGSVNSPSSALLPTARSDVSQSVAVGRNALLHALKSDSNLAIGVNSLAHLVDGSYNVGVGTRALRDCVKGSGNTGIGNNAAALNITGSNNVAIGFNSLYSGSHTVGNVAVGSEAAFSLTGTDVAPSSSPTARRNVYIGTQSGKDATDGSFNTAVGSVSLLVNRGAGNVALGAAALTSNTTGGFNVAVGYEALKENDVGSGCVAVGQYALLKSKADNNTAVGQSALRYTTTGGSHVGYTNCTGIGYDARVSGNNQVQLGDTTTTTYVYGTVQNRSDARDKIDVEDTALGIDFIMGLRPVDGRWDLRDAYIETDGDTVRNVTKDGSRAGKRKHHWFIAQEVKELCDKMGVEFGGYQDHKVNDGDDVLTLGYDEFIPPTVKAVQDCWKRMDELEARLAKLES